MTHIPEHLVVQHILPHIHQDLPIDTRLHFGMPPRKLVVDPELRERLDVYIREHTFDWTADGYGYDDLAANLAADYYLRRVPETGISPCARLPYHAVWFHVRIFWWQHDSTMSFTLSKRYIGRGKHVDVNVEESYAVHDIHTGQLYQEFTRAFGSC